VTFGYGSNKAYKLGLNIEIELRNMLENKGFLVPLLCLIVMPSKLLW